MVVRLGASHFYEQKDGDSFIYGQVGDVLLLNGLTHKRKSPQSGDNEIIILFLQN